MNANHFDILIKEAKKSNMYYKHAACIVKGNKIISIGHNFMPSYLLNNKKSIHAERAVIYNTPKLYRTKKCLKLKLIVIRLSRTSDGVELSKPCKDCISYINNFNNINQIYYSN